MALLMFEHMVAALEHLSLRNMANIGVNLSSNIAMLVYLPVSLDSSHFSLHSLSALLPRTHAYDHKRHAGPHAARGDPESGQQPDGKGFERTWQRWRTRVDLPPRLIGGVHKRNAHPLSAAHAGDSVAGLHPLPHQKKVNCAR